VPETRSSLLGSEYYSDPKSDDPNNSDTSIRQRLSKAGEMLIRGSASQSGVRVVL
jgi:hypothetical protein